MQYFEKCYASQVPHLSYCPLAAFPCNLECIIWYPYCKLLLPHPTPTHPIHLSGFRNSIKTSKHYIVRLLWEVILGKRFFQALLLLPHRIGFFGTNINETVTLFGKHRLTESQRTIDRSPEQFLRTEPNRSYWLRICHTKKRHLWGLFLIFHFQEQSVLDGKSHRSYKYME